MYSVFVFFEQAAVETFPLNLAVVDVGGFFRSTISDFLFFFAGGGVSLFFTVFSSSLEDGEEEEEEDELLLRAVFLKYIKIEKILLYLLWKNMIS